MHAPRPFVVLLVFVVLFTAACSADAPDDVDSRLTVVTTVAPIADLVRQVAGDAAVVHALVPDGRDAHSFEPAARDAARLAQADVFIANGLGLEAPSLTLAKANLPDGAPIVLLGETTMSKDEWIFDRAFPRDAGLPNPHAWLDVTLAMRYVDAISDTLLTLAPQAARAGIEQRTQETQQDLRELHDAIVIATATVPPAQRTLLTYHDAWAYFGPRYGLQVVDAVQPQGMDEPSAADVRRVVDEIRAHKVTVVFGSEVFASGVLETIARETGATFIGDLADDVLPGKPGEPQHSYFGLMQRNATRIVEALGGDAAALAKLGSAR